MSSNTLPPRTRTKDPERTRKAILQGALQEFALRGFDGATVRGIAKRIDMSHGMIRYHFESKEQLWKAAVDDLFERLEREVYISDDAVDRLIAGDLDVFREFLKLYVRYCARHPEHAQIVMQESVARSPRLEYLASTHVRRSHEGAIPVVEHLRDLGYFPRGLSVASILYMITGACQNVFAMAAESRLSLGEDVTREANIDAHAEAIAAIFVPDEPRFR